MIRAESLLAVVLKTLCTVTVTGALSGCLGLVLPSGFEVAVENGSSSPAVIGAQVYVYAGNYQYESQERFYPSPPGSTVIVDTVGHQNQHTEYVKVYDEHCQPVRDLRSDMSEGALIVLADDAEPRIDVPRHMTQSFREADSSRGDLSCVEAAAKL